MKKIILSVLSFVMLLSVSVNNTLALENVASEILSTKVIEIANKYIENKDGRLIVINQDALKRSVNNSNFKAIIANVNYCNRLIEDETIGIKENGTLFVEDDTELTIQGGNINATRLYWWGWKRYNDNVNTKRIIKDLRKQANYSNSAIAHILFGSLSAAPAGFAIASIPSVLNGSLSKFANNLESKNKGYGTIIAANWVVVGSTIKSQTKNTK